MPGTHDEATLVHQSALVIDAHADTPQRFLEERWSFSAPLETSTGTGHLGLHAAREGGLGAEFFVAWVDPCQHPPERFVPRTLELLDAVRDQVRLHPWDMALCTSPDQILAARAESRFAVLMAVEGGHSIANSLGVLRTYYELGVRYMTLTWANSNDWAESSGDLRGPEAVISPGLSEFGADVVREMNRLGMMVDVSHASDRTLEDVLWVSRAPVLASHSSARALCSSPRNLSDDQLRAIAGAGGAVMVNFYSAFVDDAYRAAWNGMRAEREEAHRQLAEECGGYVPFAKANRLDRDFGSRILRPPFEALMAHFEHVIRIAGINHVGIGTDFDGMSSMPEGIDSAADLPRITEWLLGRGYSEEDVRKVLGGNLLRVFRAAEAAAD